MKSVKRWRYYCDFCKKAGGQRAAMQTHETNCTLNPQRGCRLCVHLNGGNGTPLPEMLALLPDAAAFTRHVPAEDCGEFIGEIPAYDLIDYDAMRPAISEALKKLRELTEDCPACILAALRQKGYHVPMVEDFNFTEEMKDARSRMNDARNENMSYGGCY